MTRQTRKLRDGQVDKGLMALTFKITCIARSVRSSNGAKIYGMILKM